jgi:hypothetical protein
LISISLPDLSERASRRAKFCRYNSCQSPSEEADMVVTNRQRVTAIVIRCNMDKVTLVPMKSGRLSAKTMSFAEFRRDWTETNYALAKALNHFLGHMMCWGASMEVSKGLAKLVARDRWDVAPLF